MSSNKRVYLVYLGGFLVAAHYALVVYLNSSLIKQFVGDNTLSLLYVIGSLCSIGTLLLAPFFLRKWGNVVTFLLFIFLEIIAVVGIGSVQLALIVLALFILHQAAESILYFCLDVALEHETTIEDTTGEKRSIFFTVQNVAWVLSPLMIAFLVRGDNFSNVYLLSGLMLAPLFILVFFFFRNPTLVKARDSYIGQAIKILFRGGDTARIFTIQFLLNFFYAWMLIYLPLTLNTEIGFGWDTIGVLFTIMLLPFILFEIPAGFLADRTFGEKDLLIIGLIIMTVATAFIPFLHTASFLLWAILLFSTRIGASIVEISAETYFFKHVKDKDTGLISFFRMAHSIARVFPPLFALLVLHFPSYGFSFLFLALITLSGLLFIPKKDTR